MVRSKNKMVIKNPAGEVFMSKTDFRRFINKITPMIQRNLLDALETKYESPKKQVMFNYSNFQKAYV